MKIKLLGTGSIQNNDNPTCFLINDKILIDCPNGMLKVIRKNYKLNNITSLLVTHTHADHIFDIPFLMVDKYLNNEFLTIYCSKKNKKIIKKIIKFGFPHYYKPFKKYKGFMWCYKKEFAIDDINIIKFKTHHGKCKDSFGYTFKEKDKVVTFTGDATFSKNILDAAKESNLMFADCTNVKSSSKHMGTNDICYLLNQSSKLEIIPVHLTDYSKEAIKKIKNKRLLMKNDDKEIKI